MKAITKTVWLLSIISLFTDMASEMLYPVMPVYLKSIGFSILLIGILEGLAEAIAGLSKGYFGRLSDQSGRRVPFVQLGYTLSALSKPMMALFTYPAWIFMARTTDRLGKGIRTGARDAILSDESTYETKAKVFGFHRSMDTLGAVAGPLAALIYLYFYPQDYKTLFLIAFIPGLLAIISTLLLKEKSKQLHKVNSKTTFFSFLHYWKQSSADYRKLVTGILLFTLFNSSDVFLLLKAKEAGLNDTTVIGIYIFYNLVYALFAFPIGILADKAGLKNIFIAGLLIFSIVYWGMAFTTNQYMFFFLFLLYGLYAAATEGISKAWVANISNKKDTGTAIGFLAGFQSIFTLLASSLTGLVWYKFGATTTFMITAIAVACILIYMMVFVPGPKKTIHPAVS